MKGFLIGLIIYVCGIALWVFAVLIPYGTRLVKHIESVVNEDNKLDLMFCFKQFLIGSGWTLAIVAMMHIILFFVLDKLIND
jgi:hypothetical protein